MSKDSHFTRQQKFHFVDYLHYMPKLNMEYAYCLLLIYSLLKTYKNSQSL